jgi:oligopeptidase B
MDVINSMLDPTIPLTVGEYEEWGGPNDKGIYDYWASYSPYDNLRSMDYPNMLLTTGLNDPRVSYWEPLKFVAKLRALKTDDNLVLLSAKLVQGHSGASGRYDALKELAFTYAFILERLGKGELPSSLPS